MPTIVTVYVPDGVVTNDRRLRIEVPLEPRVRPTLLEVNELVIPATVGDVVADSDTVPLKPKLSNVIVLVVEPPATKPAGEGIPPTMLKSALTITVKVTECARVPLVAVTVTA